MLAGAFVDGAVDDAGGVTAGVTFGVTAGVEVKVSGDDVLVGVLLTAFDGPGMFRASAGDKRLIVAR